MLPTPATPRPSGNSILQNASNAELMAEERAAEEEAARRQESVHSSLAAHIRTAFVQAQQSRQEAERQMLRNLRQRNGEYEQEVLQDIERFGGSDIFMRITDAKCRAAIAWISDVLNQDRPWDLEPTPIADLPPHVEQQTKAQVMQAVIAQAAQVAAIGGEIDPLRFQAELQAQLLEAKDQVRKALQQEADQAAARMADKIEDQLTECGFREVLAEALEDLVTFGTMILRAPVLHRRKTLKWAQTENGFEPVAAEDIVPEVERVSPLDIYPSDDSTGVHDGYIIEKYRISRGDLSSFKGVPGWNDAEIDAALGTYQRGGHSEDTQIDQERRDQELRQTYLQTSKLDVLIYHGPVLGQTLIEWGMDPVDSGIENPLDDYEVEAWLLGPHVVRAVLNDHPLGKRPYAKACYAVRPGSFWGIAPPEIMSDCQRQANAAARALANNMAMASGPQVGVDMDGMPPGEDGSSIHPWKVWRFQRRLGSANDQPPVTFFQPEMKANELMQIFERFVAIADEVTGIPAYVAGDDKARGAGDTASGLSMLMNAASKSIKAVIKQIDTGIIEPVIEAFFTFNMLYGEPDLKGDLRVHAKGSTSLLMKEAATLRRQEFAAGANNPVDLQIMGIGRRAELLRSIAESLDMDPDDIAPTREEIEGHMMMPPMMPPAPAQGGGNQALQPDGSPQGGTDHRQF